MFLKKILLSFLAIISLITLIAASVKWPHRNPYNPKNPKSWEKTVQKLEDNVNDLLKTATINVTNQTITFNKETYSYKGTDQMKTSPNYFGLMLENAFFRKANPNLQNIIKPFDSQYVAFNNMNNNFFTNQINRLLWNFSTNENVFERNGQYNYQEKIIPALIKETFLDDFYQVYGEWPLKREANKQKTVPLYWQFVLTNNNEYAGSYLKQTVKKQGDVPFDVDQADPFAQAITEASKVVILWNIFQANNNLIKNNFTWFKANAVIKIINIKNLAPWAPTITKIIFQILTNGQETKPLTIFTSKK